MQKHYEALGKAAANYVPLSPISFLKRAETVYGDRTAFIYGEIHRTWAQVAGRCRRFADALKQHGIAAGDTVSVIVPNIPEMFELHFSVPVSGAVLNTINTRLEAETVAYILDHADTKLIIADTVFSDLLRNAFDILGRDIEVIEIVDDQADTPPGSDRTDYESFLLTGDADATWHLPDDEWQAISLNYTSGTSGRPKGVVYHHRGGYLMALGTVVTWPMTEHTVYLSIVPMFHCNGWNHPWALASIGAKIIYTRDPVPERIWDAIQHHKVTHFGGAPIVLQMLIESAKDAEEPVSPPIKVFTAGAPPPPAILQKSQAMGLDVMQVYGLTETFGHITECLWRDEWADLSADEQAQMQSMQGVGFPILEQVRVADKSTGQDVPRDGVTQGEIAVRGNPIMKGYYKDAAATDDAFKDGWFWTGDAAVMHDNTYVQIRDRLKDVIISGGENISSIEVEGVLYRHAAVQAAAIVAIPHDRWGEVPCAFIELREGHDATEAEIINFCKKHLAGFKTPKKVVFGDIPKTSTGKIQKYVLRDRASKV
ncbi:AMP-binding protein [Parasulfitobacter algicola]|uniref:AMP-binding protein n=1 Tax=Parasulfitobacter algicola TaxID=2614809 RepID=A0ABX2ITP2_9RHOB|nr:AMP-binding protein [Sulfitobacter algicola]NSX56269.1 AMP-binding protein [Sulfitobacter algicola]